LAPEELANALHLFSPGWIGPCLLVVEVNAATPDAIARDHEIKAQAAFAGQMFFGHTCRRERRYQRLRFKPVPPRDRHVIFAASKEAQEMLSKLQTVR
jgi:hypothetical protein